MRIFLVLFLSCFFTLSAIADGTLGFSLKTKEGFWRVDIVEKDAVREGVMSMGGGRYYLTAYEQDNRLYMPFAQYTNDSLEIKVYDEKHTWYRGFLYQSIIANIDAYKDLKKGTLSLDGTIGDNLTFDYRTSISKKGKKSATLWWVDKGEENPVEMHLEIDFTPEKQEGSCVGKMYAQTEEVAKFACKSSGKLMDAFFKNEQDILAWLVHLLITPSDNK